MKSSVTSSGYGVSSARYNLGSPQVLAVKLLCIRVLPDSVPGWYAVWQGCCMPVPSQYP